jgi:hypothetical protein
MSAMACYVIQALHRLSGEWMDLDQTRRPEATLADARLHRERCRGAYPEATLRIIYRTTTEEVIE